MRCRACLVNADFTLITRTADMMENVKRGTRAAAHGLMREEYKAWLCFYQSVASNEQLAAEVLSHLEADFQMKRQHLALYVRCKQSLRVHKTRPFVTSASACASCSSGSAGGI
jgi:hypothetical protein